MNDTRVANTLNDLAILYTAQHRYADAEALLRRALAIWETAFGPNHPEVADALNNLSAAYLGQSRHREAEQVQRRALKVRETALGAKHPKVAQSLHNLALIYQDQGRYSEAKPIHEQALALREDAVGPEHPDVAGSLTGLAVVYDAEGRPEQALSAIRRAAAILQRRATAEALLPDLSRQAGPSGLWNAVFSRYVISGWRLGERDPDPRLLLTDETFLAGQRARASAVATTVAQTAARFASGGGLAELVRDLQGAINKFRAGEKKLAEVTTLLYPVRQNMESDNQHQEAYEDFRKDVENFRRAHKNFQELIEETGRKLRRMFPEYDELINPEPINIYEVQQLIKPDEAILAYVMFGKIDRTHREHNFAWLIRPDRAEMLRLDLAPGELEAAVRTMRTQIDPTQWKDGAPPRFDAALAHDLHRKLLPFDPALLAGVSHLLIVPDGPLESLPFSVLARTPPKPGASYADVDWLARTFATTTLPSVSSLRALRRFAKPSRAGEPFRGVGDPVLDGPPGPARGANVAQLLTRGLADPAQVRALPPLPETAGELRIMARGLGADNDSLYLRERATESAVKAGALSGARVVAFATHAGVAGELPGLAEPALVLTPPAAATEADDGLLTASEAAQLKLDADLVVLSACNTAAPDGTPGAPGLSGLAKAFIYAGSRALLVSHWSVVSEAAPHLTTGMLAALARDPSLGRAEALRRAMMGLLDRAPSPLLAHPAAWAPFVVVGEGGAGAPAVRPR